MVASSFVDFFTTMTEAGAALLGLVFVSVSIRRAGGDEADATPGESTLADAALLLLANGFFISAVAIVPGTHVAYAALPLSMLALWRAVVVGVGLTRAWRAIPSSSLHLVRVLAPNVVSIVVAVAQGDAAIRLLAHPQDEGATRLLAITVLVNDAVALVRSWMLIGGAREGLRAVLPQLRRSPPA
jgi:hypothetical protein